MSKRLRMLSGAYVAGSRAWWWHDAEGPLATCTRCGAVVEAVACPGCAEDTRACRCAGGCAPCRRVVRLRRSEVRNA